MYVAFAPTFSHEHAVRETFHGTLQATCQPVLIEMNGSFVVDEAPTRPCVQNRSFVCSPFLGGVQWSTLRQHVHRVCHGNVTLNVRNDLILQASVSQTPPCCPYVLRKGQPFHVPQAANQTEPALPQHPEPPMHILGTCCNKLRSTKKLQMCGRLQPVPSLAYSMCQPRLVNLGHCCGTATRQYPLQCPLDILLRFESEQNHGLTPSTGYVAYQYDHKRHAWSCTIASTLCCVLLCAMQQNVFVFSKVSHVGSSHKCATQLQTIDSEFLEHTKSWTKCHSP